MTFDEKVQAAERTWTTAEVVTMIQRAEYRNATDTCDKESLYQALGIDFVSNRKNHVPVAEANREHPLVKVRRLIEECGTLEAKEGTYWSSARNKAVYDAVQALNVLKAHLEGDQL